MCEKLASDRIRTCDPHNPRRRVPYLATNVLTTRPQRPLGSTAVSILTFTQIHFPSSFILYVRKMCMIFKPQVCIVSNIHVHCCRVTHKPNEAHSEVSMYRHAHFNSRVLMTCLTPIRPSVGFV